jgi:hypothetical protein
MTKYVEWDIDNPAHRRRSRPHTVEILPLEPRIYYAAKPRRRSRPMIAARAREIAVFIPWRGLQPENPVMAQRRCWSK